MSHNNEQMTRDDDTAYIAMLSGGQDSTAMTIRLLELGYPVDYIIFSDTTLEFDEMYEYIDKLDAFFQRKYGISITRLSPRKTFDHWVFGEVTSGDMQGKIRGVPLKSAPCYWRREAKEISFDDWIKEKKIKKYIKYVGYVYNEFDRWKDIAKYNSVAPLVDWKWNEPEVQAYLKENQMENKLYQDFTRTGCAICPKQTIDDKFMLWKSYPKQWQLMKDYEERLTKMRKKRGEEDRPAFHDKYTMGQMEKMFLKKDRTPTFEFEFEPVQDCFCKI